MNTPAPAIVHDVQMIALHEIEIGEQMIRADPDSDQLDELALDIQRRGLLQAIGVTRLPSGRYQLRYGSRRLAAHRKLGATHIAARIFNNAIGDLKGTAMAENLQRRQLSIAEECAAVRHMTDVDQMSPASIAASVGKSRAWVMQRLEVPNYPPELQDALLEDRISIGAARELARLPNDERQAYALQLTINARWTAAQVRQAVDNLLAAPDVQEAIDAGINARDNPAPALKLMGTCAICGMTHPLDALALVRVCAAGCAQAALPPKGD